MVVFIQLYDIGSLLYVLFMPVFQQRIRVFETIGIYGKNSAAACFQYNVFGKAEIHGPSVDEALFGFCGHIAASQSLYNIVDILAVLSALLLGFLGGGNSLLCPAYGNLFDVFEILFALSHAVL